MSEEQLRTNVYAALKTFQDSLRTYRRETGSPPEFLISGASPAIPRELLAGCKVLPRREDIIADLPKGGIGVEVGTQTGRFARTLMDLAKPRKLYLLDIDYTPFRKEHVEQELEAGTVVTREGSSWDLLEEFEDEYFDFAYIDAGHGYEMVKKDLAASLRKVKKGGYILCNDFVVWSALEAIPYGVHKAVCETVSSNKLQVTHFAFHPYGYSDIAFRNS
ncbi:class I SAM-dependent methyltransferase [Stappia sp. TSB10P1A]|uniref:class I SAM-dependent methyltransferase n=1 Tax=Stappia sp. TSB10P1A TaxID=2003585 RepID=UPI001643BB5A|nr:class I SAM-dependent methyltransferase [Stappia sp. TSB10P1A]